MIKLNKKGQEENKFLKITLFIIVALILLYIWFKVLLPNLFPT